MSFNARPNLYPAWAIKGAIFLLYKLVFANKVRIGEERLKSHKRVPTSKYRRSLKTSNPLLVWVCSFSFALARLVSPLLDNHLDNPARYGFYTNPLQACLANTLQKSVCANNKQLRFYLCFLSLQNLESQTRCLR